MIFNDYKTPNLSLVFCLSLAVLSLYASSSFAQHINSVPAITITGPLTTAPGHRSSQYNDIIEWRPVSTIKAADFASIKEDLKKEIEISRTQKKPHSSCYASRSDACFERIEVLQKILQKHGYKPEQISATIFVKDIKPGSQRSFHSAAVLYTDEGPLVYDIENREPSEWAGDKIMTPLKDWIDFDWNYARPIYALSKSSSTRLSDIAPTPINADPFQTEIKWKALDGITPTSSKWPIGLVRIPARPLRTLNRLASVPECEIDNEVNP